MEANEAAFSLLGGLVSLFFTLAILLVLLWPYVKIIQKAGYSGWHVLWMFVPVVNFVMLFVFAFSRWPIEDKVERLESRVF
jgi:uncharacterized membrane protein YhaH (DUF805 family)